MIFDLYVDFFSRFNMFIHDLRRIWSLYDFSVFKPVSSIKCSRKKIVSKRGK